MHEFQTREIEHAQIIEPREFKTEEGITNCLILNFLFYHIKIAYLLTLHQCSGITKNIQSQILDTFFLTIILFKRDFGLEM